MIRDFVRDSIMSRKWIETEWLRFQEMRYRQKGHEGESPAQYLSRKLQLRRKLQPIFRDSDPQLYSYEVADIWLHSPPAWAAHIDLEQCLTSAELIKLATDKDEQLQASRSISQLVKLMRSGALGQNGRAVHLASIEEEEYESLTADAKKSSATSDAKAPGSFPFPLATNRSKRIPPRPCRNCGSILHYDRDCASWRNRDRPTTKALPASKANSAYQASYMAMLEDLDEEYQEQCDVFHTALNEAVEATVLTAEISSSNLPANVPASVAELRTEALSLSSEECSWESLPALVAADEPPWESPSEKVYKPRPIWERPAGHAVQGVDAFKVLCHVNSLQEPAAIVVGDSGAAPTLISQRFLDSLKLSKPRRRTGRKLNLIQLTGTAGCSEYVRLNLYFQSQKGPVCLKGVEAYVVKGMVANLIIGEDTQLAWQLHTIRPNGTRHWKVGDSAYRIPLVLLRPNPSRFNGHQNRRPKSLL